MRANDYGVTWGGKKVKRKVSKKERVARKKRMDKRLEEIRAAFDPEALKRVCEMEMWEFCRYADRVDLKYTAADDKYADDGDDDDVSMDVVDVVDVDADMDSWDRDRWNEWCAAGDDDDLDYYTRTYNHDRFYFHRDNNSRILAVAHLDSVQSDPTCTVIDTNAGPLVLSGALDDRLGAYVICELLPKLGITCDLLLTMDEEEAASTAAEFTTTKLYNWMIEFDRGGTDVVMYQYETPELADLVEASGAYVGMGSYSDISTLDHLGCAGFNWGVGYADYHSKRSHAWLVDTFKMVEEFMEFYEVNKEVWLEYEDDGFGAYGKKGKWDR